MRVLYLVIAALMFLFAAVQYNDPDGPLWALIYVVPAVFALLALIRPSLITGTCFKFLGACVVLAAAATFYYWPTEPDFWRQEVWWNSETAREGLGMMVVLVSLLVVFIGRLFGGRGKRSA